MRSPRPVDVARFGLGLVAVARPEAFLRLAAQDDASRAREVVRILGVRYLAQSVGGYVLDRPWVPAVDAAVDLVHAVSMLGLAALAPAHRTLALLSAGAASTFAVADLREHRPGAHHDSSMAEA